jgi:hypothetical protein
MHICIEDHHHHFIIILTLKPTSQIPEINFNFKFTFILKKNTEKKREQQQKNNGK